MALNAYAALTWNGTALDGDSTMSEIGGVDVSSDHIEVYQLNWGTVIGHERQASLSAAHRTAEPLVFEQRLDGTVPQWHQALTENATIAGTFKIFDTNPEDGATRERFNITIEGGRVVSVQGESPDAFDADQSNKPCYVRVKVTYHTITYEDMVLSKVYTDNWSQSR
ncbi:MAG: type VI secretion system tube protein Hcp [Sandaracinaceae bacterium]